jgi:hypothetical protein
MSLVALIAAAASQAATAPDTAPLAAADWRRITQSDIASAYDIYFTSHPGVLDPGNPGFPGQLKLARDKALAFAAKVHEAGYKRALAIFSAEMQDGHAFLKPMDGKAATEFEWPGFVSAWRGDRLLVHRAAEDGAPRGSVIESCDGRKARDLLNAYEFSWRGRPREAGQWWSHGTYLFLREPAKSLPHMKACKFRYPDGRLRSHKLAWTAAPPEAAKYAEAAIEGEPSQIGLSEPRPGIFMIGMPTFTPDEAGNKAYDEMLSALARSREAIGQGRAVVIDLRHNKGGSSSYSRKAGNILWGEAPVKAAMGNFFKDVEIWWRASLENAARHRATAKRLRSRNLIENADTTDAFAAGIEQAAARKERFFVQSVKREAVPVPQPSPLPPVYVITDGSCFSACLDAIDLFKRFPGVKLIGAPTSADSAYMEVVSEKLPSGKAQAFIPTKIWVGKPRKNGEVYTPDILVTALDWTADTFLDVVERDLAK